MSPFQQFINSLSDEEISQIARGDSSISCNEEDYCLSQRTTSSLFSNLTPNNVKEQIIEMESQLLEELYSQRPLCRSEFEYQAMNLLEKEGIEKFCQHKDQPEHWSLMIDNHHLIAISPEDPRNQYGYFCETAQNLNKDQAESIVMKWLKSHEAYDDYRSKTVCKYCV